MNDQHIGYQEAKERVAALRSFYVHLVVYVIVNLGLFLLNMIASRGSLWFYWPLAGWGIGVVLHAVQVFGAALSSNWEAKRIDAIMKKR